MIKLGAKREDRWLDLPYGVRVRVHPFSTAVNAQAQACSRKRIRKLRADWDALKELDEDPVASGMPNLEEDEVVEAQARELYVVSLAQASVFEWEGVGDEGGNELPCSQEAIAVLMVDEPLIADEYLSKYLDTSREMAAEGNVSAPEPGGTSESGANIADTAENSTSPAVEESEG